MRLFLLPISTRQSLLYCHRLAQATSTTTKPSLVDKLTTKATTTWLEWEHKESGWQKKVTDYGNKAFQRVPHEEWGLKSLPPPPSAQRLEEEEARIRGDPVKVEYPEGLIGRARVMEALRRMGGDEKQAFHRKWLIGSVVGMPITAPLALMPIIPNLPFFYLVFRAWSHWKAWMGSQNLGFLLDKDLIKPTSSAILRAAYTQAVSSNASMGQLQVAVERTNKEILDTGSGEPPPEQLLLSKTSGKIIAEQLEVPALEVEIERAIWQVERDMQAQEHNQHEKELKPSSQKTER